MLAFTEKEAADLYRCIEYTLHENSNVNPSQELRLCEIQNKLCEEYPMLKEADVHFVNDDGVVQGITY